MEAKLLRKKVVAMLLFESEAMDSLPSQENKIPQRVTQELLSIAMGVAHYLKLLIRIGLQGSLRLERDKSTSEGLFAFLETISTANKMLDRPGLPEVYGQQGSDLCQTCGEPINVACIRFEHREWHTQCFKCDDCETELGKEYWMAYFKDHMISVVYCGPCNDRMFRFGKQGFMRVTLLEQYTYLLQVALVRLADIPNIAAAELTLKTKPVGTERSSSIPTISSTSQLGVSLRRRPVASFPEKVP
jgi:hypothetical protein